MWLSGSRSSVVRYPPLSASAVRFLLLSSGGPRAGDDLDADSDDLDPGSDDDHHILLLSRERIESTCADFSFLSVLTI
jgi:hypothetical protein